MNENNSRNERFSPSEGDSRPSPMLELVKNLLLTLLVISLIALTVIYIGGTHIYQSMTDTGEKNVFDKLWSTQSDHLVDGLEADRLLPELIAYRLAGEGTLGSIADRESTIELYSLISPCILELFGSGSTCERVGDDELGRELFTDALASDEFIYLRYHEPVLYQLIFAYLCEKLTIEDDAAASMQSTGSEYSGGAYVSELVIIPEREVAAHRFIAYALDDHGRCFRFRLADEVVASEFHISKLAESGAQIKKVGMSFPGAAADGNELAAGALCDTQPLISAELRSERISMTYIDTTEAALREALLELFGFNIEKLRGYTSDGVGFYYSTSARARLAVGSMTYRAVDSDGGLAIDSLLGYSTVGTLSLYDKLTALDNLLTGIEDISSAPVGGEADLCLGNVYTRDGLLVIEYFLTYGNIRIVSEPTVRAMLGSDKIVSFELTASSYDSDGSELLSPPQSYILKQLSDISDGTRGLRMRYLYNSSTAQWTVITDADGVPVEFIESGEASEAGVIDEALPVPANARSGGMR